MPKISITIAADFDFDPKSDASSFISAAVTPGSTTVTYSIPEECRPQLGRAHPESLILSLLLHALPQDTFAGLTQDTHEFHKVLVESREALGPATAFLLCEDAVVSVEDGIAIPIPLFLRGLKEAWDAVNTPPASASTH